MKYRLMTYLKCLPKQLAWLEEGAGDVGVSVVYMCVSGGGAGGEPESLSNTHHALSQQIIKSHTGLCMCEA